MINHKNISEYAEVLIYFSLNLKATIEFLIFSIKLKSLTNLLNKMTTMAANSEAHATKNEKTLRRRVKTFIAMTVFTSIAVSVAMAMVSSNDNLNNMQRYFFDASKSPIKEILLTESFIIGTLGTIINVISQICYYNVCVHILTLYEQFDEQMMELNDPKVNRQAIIAKSVDYHIQIMETISMISKFFREMLVFDSVIFVSLLGMILFEGSATSGSLRMLVFLPTPFYNIFIFCHGSFLVTQKGIDSSNKLYMNLNWIDMSTKIKKSLCIMMRQLQKAVEIKILGLQKIDLELFIVVSKI